MHSTQLQGLQPRMRSVRPHSCSPALASLRTRTSSTQRGHLAQQRQLRAASSDAAATEPQQQQQQQQPAMVSIKLRKPVGVVFAQNKNGPVFVEEITTGSNADKSGQIQVGDVLSQCSAIVLKAGKEGLYEKEGYGQRVYDNWETIMMDCEGREFKTVMSALKSNNERWGINNVTLVFRKPTPEEASLCVKAEPQPAA